MIEICCKVFKKNTNDIVFDGFKNITAKFENMDDFYNYMYFRYGYDTKKYRFLISENS